MIPLECSMMFQWNKVILKTLKWTELFYARFAENTQTNEHMLISNLVSASWH